jgi:hypothetical protein
MTAAAIHMTAFDVKFVAAAQEMTEDDAGQGENETRRETSDVNVKFHKCLPGLLPRFNRNAPVHGKNIPDEFHATRGSRHSSLIGFCTAKISYNKRRGL